jgi:cation diffusion facilitator CzcD-associated flavoprotein CzcO
MKVTEFSWYYRLFLKETSWGSDWKDVYSKLTSRNGHSIVQYQKKKMEWWKAYNARTQILNLFGEIMKWERGKTERIDGRWRFW